MNSNSLSFLKPAISSLAFNAMHLELPQLQDGGRNGNLLYVHTSMYNYCMLRKALRNIHLRVYAQSFIWHRNQTKTLGFLLPLISPWFFIGFLLSLPPYALWFLRKPSFLVVLGGFFSLVFKNQSAAWFSWSCLHRSKGKPLKLY